TFNYQRPLPTRQRINQNYPEKYPAILRK
ncbi:MAG: hypothetical protein C5S41_10520, partial [Candidatus Methanomarinus sp.]